MDKDEKDLLEKTLEIEKENNHILKGLRNTNRWTTFFRIAYWVIIIGVAVGAFYFIQPYVNNIINTYENIQNDILNVKTVVNTVSKTTTTTIK